MVNKVILISGKAGVGKNTLANEYAKKAEENGQKVRIYSFAGHIKKCAKDYFGWDGKKDRKGRQLLIDLGNHFRSYNPHYLIRIVEEQMLKDFKNDDGVAIITDCRFDNEVSYFKIFPHYKKNKPTVLSVKIERDFETRLTVEQQQDPTEQGISTYLIDKVIKM